MKLQIRLMVVSLSFFSSFLLHVPLCVSQPQPRDRIISCLTDHSVRNFTTAGQNNYFDVLTMSIQNLRFMDSCVPKPLAIVMPENREQLANSVLCCRKESLEIRVRCGGHSYEGTSFTATDGSLFVLIDLVNLDKVSVDMDSETAWVEGGATLGQAYYAISESSPVHGFSAGSCPTVGIGGHISGGGFGLLSRKYGLAADNVVDAILIDANGRWLDREAMGEELFWAVRGGGGGVWGIIYAWKIKLLPVPELVTAFIVSRPGNTSYVSSLAHKWQRISPKLNQGFYISAFVGAGLPGAKTTGMSATFKGFYLGKRTDALSILNRAFPELNIMENDCRQMSWIESVLFFSGLEEESTLSNLKDRYLKVRTFFKAKSDYVKTPIPIKGITSAVQILGKEPKGYVILDPYGGIMDEISQESIAFPHRKGNLFTIQYLVEWKQEDNAKSQDYIAWIRGFYEAMTPYVSRSPRAAYVNYIDLDLGELDLLNSSVISSYDAVEKARVWGEKYFLRNYDRLVKAKTEIDPLNIFRHQQGIPPLGFGGNPKAEAK